MDNMMDTATVRGTCYILQDGEKTPVPNQKVVIGSRETTADGNGYFEINGLPAGVHTIRISGGDLGWSDTLTLKGGENRNLGDVFLHPTLPPPDTTTDKTGSDEYPDSPEGVIWAYYRAIDAQDYSLAMKYLAEQMSGGSLDGMYAGYGQYIKSVSVADIERRASMDYDGRSIYWVTFTAEYIKHYPAGNGDLPRSHALKKIDGVWKIVDIGTG
jgi:hypothetical protein